MRHIRGQIGGRRKTPPFVLVLFCFCFAGQSLKSNDKIKNPYKGSKDVAHQSSKGKPDVLYTKEKRKPTKSERNLVFQELGIPKNNWKDYVAEYRIPISLGGSNTYSNIEALPKSKAKVKHKVQKDLESKLRKKEISLLEAQTRIFNWEKEQDKVKK
jgi:hypothetical protein